MAPERRQKPVNTVPIKAEYSTRRKARQNLRRATTRGTSLVRFPLKNSLATPIEANSTRIDYPRTHRVMIEHPFFGLIPLGETIARRPAHAPQCELG